MAIVVIMASIWEYSNAGLNPETLGDRWGGMPVHNDKFMAEVNEEKRKREKYTEGTLNGCTTLVVGSSGSASKSKTIDSWFKCPITVDKSNWQVGHDYGDTFSVSQNGDQVTITRTDQEAGWGMNLKFRCCPEDDGKDAKNECISWRQTGGCDPTGPWESQFDKTCDANIPPGASGYCQCKRNGVDITQGEKKCRTKTFRNCNEACNTGK